MTRSPAHTRWAAAVCIGSCSLLTVLAMFLPAVGLPTLARELNVGDAASIGLILTAQATLAAVLLPLAGVGDWLGHRRVCTAGLWIVIIGSLGAACGDRFGIVLFFRVVQGIGCAAIFAVTSALIRESYPPEKLGRGLANNSMVVAVSSAFTPLVAAALLSLANWRLLFVLPAVFAAATLAWGVRALPRGGPGLHRPDIPGGLLILATFGPLVFGFNLLSQRGQVLPGLLCTGAGLAAGVVLIGQQRRLEQPLLPLDLLRVPALGLSIATAFASFAAQHVALTALPFILQGSLSLGTGTAGILLSVWPTAVLLTTAVVGPLSDRLSAPHVGTWGLALCGTGFALATASGPHSLWALGASLGIVGIGIGLFQVPNNRLIVISAPLHRRGMVGGLQSTTRIMGHSVGAAVAAFLLQDPLHPMRPLLFAAVLALLAAAVSALRLQQGPGRP